MVQVKFVLGMGSTDEEKSCYNDALTIRKEVFIKEQGVDEAMELDGVDDVAIHLVLYHDEKPVATGRIVFREENNETKVFLTRIAVLEDERKKGYGEFAVRLLIRQAYDGGWESQFIHSQLSARGFYEKLGFTCFGEVFYEAGIPHVNMVHEGDVGGCTKHCTS